MEHLQKFRKVTSENYRTLHCPVTWEYFTGQPIKLPDCPVNYRRPGHPFMLTPEHVTALNDLIDNHKPDIALTETWIRSSTTPAELIDSTPPGYSLFSVPRSHTGNPSKPILAGGTAFLIIEHFIQNSAAHHYSSSITQKFPKTELTSFHVYRPPPPSPYFQPFSTFLNQFSSFLSHAANTPHEFIITGDFNIHVDDLGDTPTIQFFDLLVSCNLTQHV